MTKKRNKYSVLFVCLGNICRSPLAEGVFRRLVEQEGFGSEFVIDSCGTGAWHVGEPPHRGSRKVAREHGFDISDLRARQISNDDFYNFDLLVAMDAENEDYLRRRAGKGAARICLLRDYDPERKGTDVPDPYYEGNFENVYDIIERCCRSLLERIREER